MKKKTIVLILFFTYMSLYGNSLKLSSLDIYNLKKIKALSNDKMIQYSLMAIAFKESSIGKRQVNVESGDYGIFQSNIKTVLRRLKVKDTLQNRKKYSSILLKNQYFAAANAIVELKYWRKYHKNNWARIWASYNTGFNYDGKIGMKYSQSIFKIIKKLKYEYKL